MPTQNAINVKNWRKRLKDKVVAVCGHACNVCGYDRCDRALEFHHIDESKKDFSISQRTHQALEKVFEELRKCVMVCANCHREIHEGLVDIRSIEILFDENLVEFYLEERKPKVDKCFCGATKSIKRKFCSISCSSGHRNNVKIAQLGNNKILEVYDIKKSYAATGRYFGVSGAAIKRRINKINGTVV